eukprot:jgi/Astpho2/3302/Aster-x0156
MLHTPRPTLSPEDLDEDASWAAAAVRSELNETPIDNIKELDLLQLSAAISSYVASSESPPHLVLEQVAQRLEVVLKEEFDPDAVTTVLNSLALFGYEASETLIEAIRAALTASYFTCCDPEQLAHLIHAVAQMGHKNAKLLDAVANEVMGRIKDFQPALLASLMWSFALLGHLHTHLTDAVTQHALFKLRSMDIPTICQLVCAFALLRHKDAITDVFLDAVSDEAIKRIRSFEATDMANLLWAYASLGHWSRIDADLLEAVVLRMLRMYRELNAAGLVNVVWSIAKTDHASRLTHRLLEGVAGAALEQLDQFTPEHLSRLLWAYSTLRIYSPELYSAVAYQTLQKLDEFETHHVADLVTAYAIMVHHPGDLLLRLTAHIYTRLENMSAGALCAVLWGQGVLGTLTPEFFQRAVAQLENKGLGEFEPQDFERAFQAEMLLKASLQAQGRHHIPCLPEWVRGYARRAWQDRVYFDRDAGRVQQEVGQAQCKALERDVVCIAADAFCRRSGAEAAYGIRLPAQGELVLKLRRVPLGKASAAACFCLSFSCKARMVCRTLMELGIDFELDNFLEDGCHSVGIRIPKPKRPRLAIELVPPQRFTVNKPHRLLAEAVCQQRLLHSLDWDIIMLPQHEWRKLPSRDAKAHYLESLLTPRPVLPRPVFDAEEEEALAACHAAAQAVHMAAAAFDRRPTA